MFSKVKNIVQKNLILIPTLLVIGLVIATPKFLGSEKKAEPKPQGSTVTTSNKTQETSTADQQTITPPTTKNQVQGTTTYQTTQKQTSNKNSANSNPTPTAPAPVEQTVTLNINTGSGNYPYQVSWSAGMTVYDVLVKASSENKFSLVARWYGAPLNSYYITELHGHNCECWTYTVKDKDGKDVPGKGKGVSLDTLSPDNIITWKTT